MTEQPTPLHALYGRWLEDLWNGSPDVAGEIVSRDFVGHWPGHDVNGPDGLAATVGEAHEMFTDLSFTLEVGPIVEGDMIAARWTGRGRTPEGPMTFIGNDILRVRDGRFVEYWVASVAQS